MKPLHKSSCGRDTPGPSLFSAGGHGSRQVGSHPLGWSLAAPVTVYNLQDTVVHLSLSVHDRCHLVFCPEAETQAKMALYRPLERVLGIAATTEGEGVDHRALPVLAVGDVDGAVGSCESCGALAGVALGGGVWHAGLEGGTWLPVALIQDQLALFPREAVLALTDIVPVELRENKASCVGGDRDDLSF